MALCWGVHLGGCMRSALALLLSCLTLAAQAPKTAVSVPVQVTGGFVGNKAARVFHTPACKLGQKTKPENRVTFATREEALKAGFTPCKICLP